MIHVVKKWRVSYFYPGSQPVVTFDIDNDFYSEVLKLISHINAGINVERITINLVVNGVELT